MTQSLLDELKSRLMMEIDPSKNISDKELNGIISNLVMVQLDRKPVSLREKMRICNELFNSIRGLDVLQDILDDDEISEIMVNGYRDIFIEKKGILKRFDGEFSSEEKLMNVIQIIAAKCNKRVNESTPILDARLEDGSRINIVLPPVALNGPVVTIRKFPKTALTMEHLISIRSITREAADFLKGLVENGYNIFISGGTGSGKTTFLNALSGYIPSGERIITIEDSAELKIEQIANLVRMECRQANAEGENAISIRDLIRTSLRMRPNRIIVGEVRGKEALDMLQAMNTGHDGSISTGHGNSPMEMLSRLEVMTLMAGEELPAASVRRQIGSALDILIHLGRMKNGQRKVLSISQVEGYENDQIKISSLFEFIKSKNNMEGILVRTDVPLRVIKGNMEA